MENSDYETRNQGSNATLGLLLELELSGTFEGFRRGAGTNGALKKNL